VLVPAVMELLGKANWWLPGWLDRLLPQTFLSEDEPPAEAPAAVPLPAASRSEVAEESRPRSD
jgi:putative drug exporter of the RND superfamily